MRLFGVFILQLQYDARLHLSPSWVHPFTTNSNYKANLQPLPKRSHALHNAHHYLVQLA